MCFGLEWIAHIIIAIIVICAVIALIRLLIAFVLPRIGLGGDIVNFIVSALYIVMWAVICIAAVIFIFDLIACLVPYMSGSGTARIR